MTKLVQPPNSVSAFFMRGLDLQPPVALNHSLMAMTICLEDRCLANVGHSVAIVAFGCFRGGVSGEATITHSPSCPQTLMLHYSLPRRIRLILRT
ncbi:hypothetical protein HBI37_165930 [Parastagonospora nodorum]|nr:hypothetical protein HBI37_165930 [Parastagonospora nodorum]KAH6345376.1 hypothetical protein HBI36_159110 [Parastagonospora nodorum]